MAKGRKLTTSRSERFLGTYDYANSRGSAAVDPSELREEDVWSTGDDTGDREWDPHASSGSNGGDYRRRIPRDTEDHRRVGGLSLAFEAPASGSSQRIVHQFRAREEMAATPRGRHMATSAPVNVPDWSKILRVDSVESMNDDEEDDESEMVPPHEYLARSQKMVANSVFEGVGRTLKGRDLSRVRDAVWSQTGKITIQGKKRKETRGSSRGRKQNGKQRSNKKEEAITVLYKLASLLSYTSSSTAHSFRSRNSSRSTNSSPIAAWAQLSATTRSVVIPNSVLWILPLTCTFECHRGSQLNVNCSHTLLV